MLHNRLIQRNVMLNQSGGGGSVARKSVGATPRGRPIQGKHRGSPLHQNVFKGETEPLPK
jgi:hypothetical protein